MSILIKGVKKPKKCLGFDDKCPFLNDEDNCVLQGPIDGTWDDLYANCPLVELPEKHGDLIDRKALSDAVLKWIPSDPCGKEEKEFPFEEDICVSMMMEIEEQPTVIEAEGEG